MPAYKGRVKSCAKYAKPEVLMPAHAAPLGMIYYHGAMFPDLLGKLVVSLHGYRATGHRIVVYDRDSKGRPLPPPGPGVRWPLELVGGWDELRGVRPRGAPVTLANGLKGEIWFAEDKNRTVMVVMKGTAAAAAPRRDVVPVTVRTAPAGWAKFQQKLIPACGQCHEDFKAGSPQAAWGNLIQRGWIDQDAVAGSKLIRSLQGQPPLKPMPPPSGIGGLPGGRAALGEFLRGLP